MDIGHTTMKGIKGSSCNYKNKHGAYVSDYSPYKYDDEVTVKFAKNVKERRIELGYSQAELSRKAGVAQTETSRIESRSHQIKLITAIKISKALGCSLVDLIK